MNINKLRSAKTRSCRLCLLVSFVYNNSEQMRRTAVIDALNVMIFLSAKYYIYCDMKNIVIKWRLIILRANLLRTWILFFTFPANSRELP